MKKAKLFLPLIALLAVAFLYLAINFSMTSLAPGENGQTMSLKYTGVVCVYKNGDLIQCDHNQFTNMGQNLTRQALINGVNGVITNYIALGNSTVAIAATDVTLPTPGDMANECTLGRAQGTITNQTTGCTVSTCPGNWTISKLWTYSATCSGTVTINTTGLYQGATGNNLFADNTFTPATLSPNDQINVTWYIWVV